jgi:hypothetical protein
MGRGCYLFFIPPMASFQNFKDNALSYLVVCMITVVGYKINVIEEKLDIMLERTTSNTVRIQGLEREVYKTAYKVPTPPYKLPLQVDMREVVAILNDNDLTPRKYETFN